MGAMTSSDDYGLGDVTDDELARFRTWLVTSKSPTVSPRVAGDYVSRLRRVLRGDDVSTLTTGVQNDIETAVRTFRRFRLRS